jgi:undecaprenyl-diphosphatase
MVPPWESDLFFRVNGWLDLLTPLFVVVMVLGTFWAIPAVTVALALAHQRGAAASVALGGVMAWVGARLVKAVVERERPAALLDGVDVRQSGVTGYGFVSGHATTSFAIASALVPWLPPRWRWVPLALAVAISLGRLYVGVHLPLDVIGGAGLGIACGSTAAWSVRRYRRD